MENIEPGRRYRRRARRPRRKHQATLETLLLGRAPLGLCSGEALSDVNIADLDSNSDISEDLQGSSFMTLGADVTKSARLTSLSTRSRELLQFNPLSPDSQPLLTSRADTPMLGAQARAAELAAASAAKQRQVSRELEEQLQSPNLAVSLSAFTKPQPTTSRNKGNKTWKPLVLDDLIETSDDASTSDRPTCTTGDADRPTAKESSDCKKIPTAPRAMVVGRKLSTVVAHAQPAVQPSPVTNMPARSTPLGHGPLHRGGFQYPGFTQNMYLHQPIFIGGMPVQEAPHFEAFGSMMVPDDISPIKQEQKFALLENIPFPPRRHNEEVLHPSVAQHGVLQHDGPFPHGTHQHFGDDQQYTWHGCGRSTYHPGYRMTFQGQQQHLMEEYGNEPDRAVAVVHIPEAAKQRLSPTQAKGDNASDRCAIIPFRPGLGQQASHDSNSRYQEPYDTGRAMKECVNKLKEKAKDGKTVLHNPEVKKEPQEGGVLQPGKTFAAKSTAMKTSKVPKPPVPWEVLPKDTNRTVTGGRVLHPTPDKSPKGANMFTVDIENDTNLRNIKPDPCLPTPQPFGSARPSLGCLEAKAADASSAAEVGSVEWMRLAPITAAERERVRRCMALAAKSITNAVPMTSIIHGEGKDDMSETQRWFHTDARGERLLREQVNLAAQAHASNVTTSIKACNGGQLPEHFKDGKDDGMAATLILGNVACNLQTYLVGDRKSIEQRRNFYKVKSVPDWCTERGGLVPSAVGGGDSYFDGAAGGFHGAPVRVARDPRFRPQMKEGWKVNAEEEWKNRHEMYGRRII